MTLSARAFRKLMLLDAILYRTVTNRLAADGQTEGRRLHIRRCYSGESSIAKKGYSSVISVRPNARPRLSVRGFPCNLVSVIFMEICRGNQNLV
jgi:hypothetical protein